MASRIRVGSPHPDGRGRVAVAVGVAAPAVVLAVAAFGATTADSTPHPPLLELLGAISVAVPAWPAAVLGGREGGPSVDAVIVLAWALVGAGSAASATVGVQLLQGAVRPSLAFGYAVAWGCVLGLVVGVYDVRRRRRRRDLERVNRLNAELRAVHTAMVTASSREEIERDVCDRLTALDGIRYAWFGELTQGTTEVVRRSVSGVVPDEAGTARADGGTPVQVEALRAGEPAVRRHAAEPESGAVAATPVTYDEFPYGVLTVGLDRDFEYGAFECRAFANVGRRAGDAIHALRSREALVADSVVELTFEVTGDDLFVTSVSGATGGRLELRSAQHSEGSLFAFYDAVDVDPRAVAAAAEAADDVATATVVDDWSDGPGRVQVVEDSPLYAAVTDRGGSVRSVSAAAGVGEVCVRLPRSADVRGTVDAVREVCPRAELVSRKDRPGPVGDDPTADRWTDGALTDRQLLVAQTAYHGGYFETPRRCSGEELAASLDISPPTFHDHLRTAERTLFETVFEGPNPQEDDGG